MVDFNKLLQINIKESYIMWKINLSFLNSSACKLWMGWTPWKLSKSIVSPIILRCLSNAGLEQSLCRLFHSLLAQHLTVIGAVQGGCQWPLENGRNLHWFCKLKIHYDRGNTNLYLDKRAMSANWRPCLIPTNSPNAGRLWLCSSLVFPNQQQDRNANICVPLEEYNEGWHSMTVLSTPGLKGRWKLACL